MAEIITALTIAKRDGCLTSREWIEKAAKRFSKKVNFKKISGEPVAARIDFGRWVCDCECGGAEYVDPADPVFYCMSCGNTQYEGGLRPVVFPKNREEIEAPIVAGKYHSWKPEVTNGL